jgi:HlyD family secretion protein
LKKIGTVEAQTVSKIGVETAGVLVELKVDHGDEVEAGALLARLHSREQEARVAQARAAVAQAQAAIEQAQAAAQKAEVALKQKMDVNARRQHLVQRGVVSKETAEDTQAAADIAKAALGQARTSLCPVPTWSRPKHFLHSKKRALRNTSCLRHSAA